MNAVTKADLIDEVVRKYRLPHKEARRLVDSVLGVIYQGVVKGSTVKIPKLGTWTTKLYPSRIAQNPRTGKKFKTRPKVRVQYKASPALKKAVNKKKGKTRPH